MDTVISGFTSLGAKFTAGIVEMKHLVVESLTVGSSEKPSVITLYDEVSGQPYCLKIYNGNTLSVAGACEVAPEEVVEEPAPEEVVEEAPAEEPTPSEEVAA